MLDRFLEAAADVAQADGAMLGLVADDSMIELTAASGVLASLAGDRLPVAGSAMGRIIRSGGSWSVADVRQHPDAVSRSWYDREIDPVRGMAVVPVQRRGERVGAVAIVSREAHTFSPLELERVEAMSDLLSVALANFSGGSDGIIYNAIALVGFLAFFPALLLVILIQNHLSRGLTMGAVKG